MRAQGNAAWVGVPVLSEQGSRLAADLSRVEDPRPVDAHHGRCAGHRRDPHRLLAKRRTRHSAADPGGPVWPAEARWRSVTLLTFLAPDDVHRGAAIGRYARAPPGTAGGRNAERTGAASTGKSESARRRFGSGGRPGLRAGAGRPVSRPALARMTHTPMLGLILLRLALQV
jgi:hypothetical protein